MTYVKVIPIQTLEYNHETYLISQVRVCRKCHKPLDMMGNHRLYFDIENRLALHEHIDCVDEEIYSS